MYVPPSKRAGYTPRTSSALPADLKPRYDPRRPGTELYTASDISRQFTHPQDSSITFFSKPLPFAQPPRDTYDPTRRPEEARRRETARPHVLSHLASYIVLFRNAHPDWDGCRELWMHTNGEKMIEDYGTFQRPGRRQNFGRPIPIFKSSYVKENLEFVGWFQIDKLRVVPSQSDELKELLQRKEAANSYKGGRSAEAWAASLAQQWIKLRLSPCPPSSTSYTSLEHPMRLRGGEGGEVERYLLKVGGLDEELAILEREKASEGKV